MEILIVAMSVLVSSFFYSEVYDGGQEKIELCKYSIEKSIETDDTKILDALVDICPDKAFIELYIKELKARKL